MASFKLNNTLLLFDINPLMCLSILNYLILPISNEFSKILSYIYMSSFIYSSSIFFILTFIIINYHHLILNLF